MSTLENPSEENKTSVEVKDTYLCYLNLNGENAKIIGFKSDAERKEWINLTKESKDLIYLIEIESDHIAFDCGPITGHECDEKCDTIQEQMSRALDRGIYNVCYSCNM